MVEGAALEMLCPERDLGFESLTLRQNNASIRRLRSGFPILCAFFHFVLAIINGAMAGFFSCIINKLIKLNKISRFAVQDG